ncbi:ATP synthase mitochondrial F1 complex assembly factor 1-like [Macrobrachium nipponense]|uniref:ATP synthase mitochondrial F1 complex assembly factor 1-like n=1 Tax=Macrobrachium nipponense TaxID=159736 RepID=UPI0030C86A3A
MNITGRRIGCTVRKVLVTMSERPVSTSSYAMVKAIEELEKNPFFEKYGAKIAKYQKANPEEFLNKFEKGKEVKESQPGGHGFSEVAKKGKEPLAKAAYTFAPQKKLESIMKTDLLKDKSNEEIQYIWTEHFRNKDAVSGVIPSATYDKLYENVLKYPMFLFALPRNTGYEFIVVQFAGHEAHFTPLINYQAYQENAPECLTLVHYPDLKEERGIVLMHGEYNKDIVNSFEAQCLVNQVQMYYGGFDQTKLELVKTFHAAPDKFKHQDLISQLESFDLSSLPGKKA